MKKITLVLLGISILVGLGIWTRNLIQNKGKSLETGLFNFSIADTASVDKIVITDLNSNTFEIKRAGQIWTDKNGGCILQENVKNILTVIKNIEFKGYLPDNAIAKTINQMSAIALKVEIYQKGEWIKSWYIGTASQDHYGQIMLLDSREEGKSDQPVLMKIKGVNGIIEPNFVVDPRKWMCTRIFALSPDQIKKVEFEDLSDSGRSFSLEKDKSTFEIKQNGNRLPFIDTIKAYRYLQSFKKVHYYLPNYTLSEKQVDSVKRSKPFAKLKVIETNNNSTSLKFFKIIGEETFDNEFGEITNTDLNNFWCLLGNGQLVKCQYFVFDPLTRADLYFPFDTKKYKKITPEVVLP